MPDTTTPLLRIQDLAIDFGTEPAVHGIDLHIDPGEIVALVGESGSGKTLTARAVLGLLPENARARGSIELDGTQVVGASERLLDRLRGNVAAMVFQDPQAALNPVQTIGRQLIDALRLRPNLDAATARERAIELLRLVEIPDAERRMRSYPHQLSGGQRQRVVLALALSGEPRLVVADEPTTALDVTVQAEILDLLRRLHTETGTAILLITHNLGVVADLADRVVVLRDGAVVEQAGVDEMFRSPREPFTRELLAAVPRLDLSAAIDSQADEPAVDQPAPAAGAAPVVALDHVSFIHPRRSGAPEVTALDDVSLRIAPGEVVGLVGESGSGKTTLGRIALALTTPTSGTVSLFGRDPHALGTHELRALRRDIALVPQDPAASLDPRWTVAECVAEPLLVHEHGDRDRLRRRVAELLDAVRLSAALATSRPGELSGGQRQRVALARALALSPRLIVADEPTSALDVSVQAKILAQFTELRAEFGFASLFISHDLAVVHEITDRLVVLRHGRVVEDGRTSKVFVSPAQDYTRALVAAAPVPDPAIQRRRRQQVPKELHP